MSPTRPMHSALFDLQDYVISANPDFLGLRGHVVDILPNQQYVVCYIQNSEGKPITPWRVITKEVDIDLVE